MKTTPEFGIKVVRATISRHISPTLLRKLRVALHDLTYCGLDFDLVDKGGKVDDSTEGGGSMALQVEGGLSKLCQALQLLMYSFSKMDTRYKSGWIYSRQPESEAAYTEKIPLRSYLGKNSFGLCYYCATRIVWCSNCHISCPDQIQQ